MLYFKEEVRKEIAYGIVESWIRQKKGDEILDLFFRHGKCSRITCSLLTQEIYDSLEGCVDKTFLTLLNNLYEPISEAIDDWIDAYKHSRYEDYERIEKQNNSRRLRYGS